MKNEKKDNDESAMIYGTECWAVCRKIEEGMSVAKMRLR